MEVLSTQLVFKTSRVNKHIVSVGISAVRRKQEREAIVC